MSNRTRSVACLAAFVAVALLLLGGAGSASIESDRRHDADDAAAVAAAAEAASGDDDGGGDAFALPPLAEQFKGAYSHGMLLRSTGGRDAEALLAFVSASALGDRTQAKGNAHAKLMAAITLAARLGRSREAVPWFRASLRADAAASRGGGGGGARGPLAA